MVIGTQRYTRLTIAHGIADNIVPQAESSVTYSIRIVSEAVAQNFHHTSECRLKQSHLQNIVYLVI
jgi:hypothetical protein